MCELCELCEQLTNTPIQGNCKYATPLIFFNVYCIFFEFRAFYPQIIQNFVLPLHSHSALESHSRYRSTKSAGDQGLCSPQKSEIFGGPNEDASHAHRTFIALPSHTRARVVHKRTWCFLQMQVEFKKQNNEQALLFFYFRQREIGRRPLFLK